MATRTVRELVCDICGSTEDVVKWGLVKVLEGKQVTVDLCKEHGKCVAGYFDKLYAGTNGRKRQVLTEAQVRAKRRRD